MPRYAGEEKKAGGPEKLTHSLDILEAFATLKLEVRAAVPGSGCRAGGMCGQRSWWVGHPGGLLASTLSWSAGREAQLGPLNMRAALPIPHTSLLRSGPLAHRATAAPTQTPRYRCP